MIIVRDTDTPEQLCEAITHLRAKQLRETGAEANETRVEINALLSRVYDMLD